jgi:predicted phosphate transport protein (TIGR00153 family)
MGIFPKEIDFFEAFNRAADNLIHSSSRLIRLFSQFDRIEERTKEIHDLEHDGDTITHEIMKELNKTFLTPIDREDIHSLTCGLDDILDLMWAAADRIALYKIKAPLEVAVELSGCLQNCTIAIRKAIQHLKAKDYPYVLDICIEINRLENEGNSIFRRALGDLINGDHDPFFVIQWKEILEYLVHATDRCEDVADILEGIVIKYA